MTQYPKVDPDKDEKEDNTLPIYNSSLYSDDYFSTQALDKMYEKMQVAMVPKQSITYNTVPSTINTSINNIKNINWKILTEYPSLHLNPSVGKYDVKIEVHMDNGSQESVTREELIKYISERKLIQENEAVRTMYERYQVAVKLVRSDDNGDTGV
jgi:hypothetical protein